MSRPEEVENAAGTRHAVCLSPAPGGVEFVMSPQLTSCQVGWRESSAGGFRHAELARREVGWIVLRWARITQADPWSLRSSWSLWSPWRAPRGAGCTPSRRPGSDPSQARPAPPQGRRGPRPSRPGPAGSASTSLNPRARTSSRRSRGLSDVLADDQTRPHPNLADDHHAVNAPTNHHAPTSPAPHHTAPRSRTAVSGEKGLASGRRSDSYHRKCVIQLLGWSIAGLPAPGRHPFARGGVRDMSPSGRRADRLASAWLRGC